MFFIMSMTMIMSFFHFLHFLLFSTISCQYVIKKILSEKMTNRSKSIVLSFFLYRSIIKCEQLFFESKHFVFLSLMQCRSSFVIIRVMMYACARFEFFALSEFSLISVRNRDFSIFSKSLFL
jgi:hypothetical protein